MGFFSKPHGNPHPTEAQLVETYAAMFLLPKGSIGLGSTSPREAKSMARDMVAKAKKEIAQEGQSTPPYHGDSLLQHEATNPKVHAMLEALRAEGVRDEDVSWFWNMSDLERNLIEEVDSMNRFAAFVASREEGLNGEQAANKVFSIHPKFGIPSEGEGDDRPIPIELKLRIINYLERHYDSPDLMRQKTEQATSFNALVRAEIRAGNL